MAEKIVKAFSSSNPINIDHLFSILDENSCFINEVIIVPKYLKHDINHYYELEVRSTRKKPITFTDIYKAMSSQLHIMRNFMDHRNLKAILYNESKYDALTKILAFMNDCNGMVVERIHEIKEKIHQKKYQPNEDGKNKLINDLKEVKELLNYYWLDPFYKISFKAYPFIQSAIQDTQDFSFNKIELSLNKILHLVGNYKNFGYKKRTKKKKTKSPNK